MANIYIAILKTLLHEDSTLSGKVTTDSGGVTRWGISERGNPDLAPVSQLPLEKALQRYKQNYDEPGLEGIEYQLLMDMVYDLGVVMGVQEAVRLLQMAVGTTIDGKLGTVTLAAVNADPIQALHDLADEANKRFQSIGGDALQGWLNRVQLDLAPLEPL